MIWQNKKIFLDFPLSFLHSSRSTSLHFLSFFPRRNLAKWETHQKHLQTIVRHGMQAIEQVRFSELITCFEPEPNDVTSRQSLRFSQSFPWSERREKKYLVATPILQRSNSVTSILRKATRQPWAGSLEKAEQRSESAIVTLDTGKVTDSSSEVPMICYQLRMIATRGLSIVITLLLRNVTFPPHLAQHLILQ